MSRPVFIATLTFFFHLLIVASLVSPAGAQLTGLPSSSSDVAEEAEVPPGEPSPNDVRELSRLLTDPAIVAWLQERAASTEDDAVAEEVAAQEALRERAEALAARIQQVGVALGTLPTTPGVVKAAWDERFSTNERLALLNLMIIFLFTGIGLEWLYWRYAARLRRWADIRHAAPLGTKTIAVLTRLALVLVGVLVFTAGILGTFGMLQWPPQFEELVLECLLPIVGARLAIALALAIWSPKDDSLRLVPLRRRSAGLMTYGAIGVALLLLGSDTISATSQLLGAEPTAGLGIEIIGAALAAILAAGLFWVIHFRTDPAFRNRTVILAATVTVVSAAIFLLWLVGASRAAWTVFVIALLVHVATLLKSAIGRAFAGEEEGPEAQESRENMAGIYQPVAERLGRFFVVAAGLVVLALIWGIEPWNVAGNDTTIGKIVSVGVDVLVAWLIGDLVWTLTRTAIDRKMASMPKLEHGQAPGPEARMATLLPLFRKVVMVTVIAMVVLITLSSLGINIAPILAGAGVVGLAIGFGAQALVRDIVSGVFFLIDDAFRVGEYIEMGELRGTVESISIRSLRVRHHRGAVHTIPFGELKSLTNYSRDWVMMKLEFRVPFDTDLRLAKKIVKGIDAELRANPDYGHHFIEPLKFQGVRRMEEFNMVVGVKFMTKPGEQWTIRRDAYQRIRDEFEKNGIHFAQRNVKVEVIGSGPITDEVKEAAVGAAQDAIEQQAGPMPDAKASA